MGLLSWKMKRFWDDTMREHWMAVDGKIGCAFSSSGGWGGGTELACQSIFTVLINFGFLVFGVTDYVGKLTTLHYGAIAAREPRSEEAQAACRMLGTRLAEWTAALIHGRKDQHPLNKPEPRMPPG
jgi:NAD(P)H dehydrogenase (quinone)